MSVDFWEMGAAASRALIKIILMQQSIPDILTSSSKAERWQTSMLSPPEEEGELEETEKEDTRQHAAVGCPEVKRQQEPTCFLTL